MVSVYAPGDSQTMKPLIRPGATAKTTVQTAEPPDADNDRERAKRVDKCKRLIICWLKDEERRRARNLRRMERLADELETIPHLPTFADSLVHQAHDILVHEGMLVMESDEEDM